MKKGAEGLLWREGRLVFFNGGARVCCRFMKDGGSREGVKSGSFLSWLRLKGMVLKKFQLIPVFIE
ncbi:hypothetical protein GCM10007924_23820 [Sneathiella chinensis]|uniref:Uncharacterized protein n=1 Tax=Sneathiella chinensis TaxID=349750 RepID=A0ABQ5U6X5_9PROT|nr:hypothetical protein GCM10007924_23820 [Sneathiella chinensis]